VLYVSHLNPYKNVLEVVEGFARLADDPDLRDVQLVISGMTNFPWYRAAIEERIARRGLTGRVILTGLVTQEQVHSLLAGCHAFVFASTCENCPTSLIEALSFGIPTASSDVGAMPETAADAVIYFDPNDPASIAAAMRRLLGDAPLRSQLRTRALDRAAGFISEAEVARRTLDVLVAAAGGRPA
jgi:glycosyltransferase involved in cell wall biosynthesis